MALITVQLSSSKIGHQTPITIIHPDNITNKEDLKVMFLLHGYSGGHQDFLRYTLIEKAALEKNMVVVMPAINNSFYTNMDRGPAYFDYLTIELYDLMKNMFGLNMTNKNTYVAGISMGAYGALKYAFRFPNRFKAVYSLSGLVNINSSFESLRSEGQTKMLLGAFGSKEEAAKEEILYNINKDDIKFDIYLRCGGDDFLYQNNLDFVEVLKEKGIKHNFISNEGNHNWNYWNDNLLDIFKSL